MGVLFVAGIHGVGKTTCCQEASEQSKVPHYSASALIKAKRADAIASTSKIVAHVTANQELLVAAVERLLRETPCFLLDGHFTVLNAAKQIEAISVEVFARLHLDGIVLYRDEPDKIRERIVARDQADHSDIAVHQLAEENQAKTVAAMLGINIWHLNAFDVSGLCSAIVKIWPS